MLNVKIPCAFNIQAESWSLKWDRNFADGTHFDEPCILPLKKLIPIPRVKTRDSLETTLSNVK